MLVYDLRTLQTLSQLPQFPVPWRRIRWDEVEKTSKDLCEYVRATNDLNIFRQLLTSAARKNYPTLNIPSFDIPTRRSEADKIAQFLPASVQSALEAKTWVGYLPHLKEGEEAQVIMNRSQVYSLLGNSFLSVWPWPKANFSYLFAKNDKAILKVRDEKLKCFIQYFQNQPDNAEEKVICYERRNIPGRIEWASVSRPLCQAFVHNCKIEELADQSLIVDFANKRIGGGVLGRGSLQEEILFATFPELLATKMFMDPLGASEAVVVKGVTKFSEYSGYADTFEFKGPPGQAVTTQVVIIDAVQYSKERSAEQYRVTDICRELKKCAAGFRLSSWEMTDPLPVSSGAWGCGDFGGNLHLKFLIQWAAASYCGRPFMNMCLPGTGNSAYAMRQEIQKLTELYVGKQISQLFKDLKRYSEYIKESKNNKSLYEFLSQPYPKAPQYSIHNLNHQHHFAGNSRGNYSNSSNRKRDLPPRTYNNYSHNHHSSPKQKKPQKNSDCSIL